MTKTWDYSEDISARVRQIWPFLRFLRHSLSNYHNLLFRILIFPRMNCGLSKLLILPSKITDLLRAASCASKWGLRTFSRGSQFDSRNNKQNWGWSWRSTSCPLGSGRSQQMSKLILTKPISSGRPWISLRVCRSWAEVNIWQIQIKSK